MISLMPLLIAPVWLVSLTLVSIGTFRLMRFARNMALRNIFTTVAVCAQCFAYGLLLIVLVVYVHLWAGGTL